MKTAIINPPGSVEENYGAMAGLAPILPQLGISFLGTYLQRRGHEVDVYDFQVTPKSQAVEACLKYDVIGFSCYITNIKVVSELIGEIKKAKPEIIIIVGGPHVTLFPEDFQDLQVDYLVCGDGEIPMTELLNSLARGNRSVDIKGVCHLSVSKCIKKEKADVINDLDLIGPPDLQDFDYTLYRPPSHVLGRNVIHTMTSRGCPFSCSFCAAAEVMGRKMRYRSIDSILSELKSYEASGFDSIMFYDDIFTINKARVVELCRRMIKQKINLKWICWSRTNTCLDLDMLRIMKDAGCYLIVFGCESIHEKTLSLLKKGLTFKDHVHALELCRKVKIDTYASFMIGLPGETKNDILQTIDFACKSSLLFSVFMIFEPFQGTPIYEVCKSTGRWEKSSGGDSNSILVDQEEIWIPNGFTRQDIISLSGKAFRDFYFYPPRALRIARHLTKLPIERSSRFVIGGAKYFVKNIWQKTSTSNAHY
jgi:anaerobic magnesium-protoporphyrin IX monomethyl ester cyclase